MNRMKKKKIDHAQKHHNNNKNDYFCAMKIISSGSSIGIASDLFLEELYVVCIIDYVVLGAV